MTEFIWNLFKVLQVKGANIDKLQMGTCIDVLTAAAHHPAWVGQRHELKHTPHDDGSTLAFLAIAAGWVKGDVCIVSAYSQNVTKLNKKVELFAELLECETKAVGNTLQFCFKDRVMFTISFVQYRREFTWESEPKFEVVLVDKWDDASIDPDIPKSVVDYVSSRAMHTFLFKNSGRGVPEPQKVETLTSGGANLTHEDIQKKILEIETERIQNARAIVETMQRELTLNSNRADSLVRSYKEADEILTRMEKEKQEKETK